MRRPDTDTSADAGYLPRLIAWEVTRSCMLACKHCRAAAQQTPYEGELSTEECFKLLDNIASFAKPIIILTGGEPMLRPDIYDIAAHATQLGLRAVMAPCGALLDDASAAKIRAAGVQHISISLDGATAASHDAFRGVEGAFEGSLRGLEAARRQKLGFQVNTTVTQHNLAELPEILELAVKLGAEVFNPFLLVPTGRGKELADQEISPEQYEQTLHWLARQQGREDILIRVTCAPHYQRILRQLGLHKTGPHAAKGCMGGQQFAFISHRGKVQICGFLDVECGDVRAEGSDFRKIWETSEIFRQMRDLDGYHGRCGCCEFARVCGGCRARAYAITGDYLDEEPFCTYTPERLARASEPDALDEQLLSIIQTDFPTVRRPWEALASRTGADVDRIVERVRRMYQTGTIRRLGAVFDSKSLGYVSTLVAACVPPGQLDTVAAMVCELPGVTHNYRREHPYNLWFTLTSSSSRKQQQTLEDLAGRTGVGEFHLLPALAVYKIRVNFQFTEASPDPLSRIAVSVAPSAEQADLDSDQQQLVRLLQESLPLTTHPFDALAARLDWSVPRVLDQIKQWRDAGVIRRFGAVVNHHRLGFTANGMAVFRVPDDRIEDAGRRLAERPEISHCYHRPALPGLDCNLYAMVHGHSEDEVRSIVDEIVRDMAPFEHTVLFSVTEYKKTSMKYFMEE